MDNGFGFLTSAQRQLMSEIVSRRNPSLAHRITSGDSVSRTDASELIDTLGTEFINNLDADWEPTEYGRAVSTLQTQVNNARIDEWPLPE